MKTIRFKIPRQLSISVADVLIFLFFLTSSADLLNIPIYLFKAKLNNLIGCTLFAFFLARHKIVFNKKLLLPFFMILISMLISATQSTLPMRSFGYVVVYLIEFFLYFLLPYSLLQQYDCERILRIYLFSFACLGTYCLIQLLLSTQGILLPPVTQKLPKGLIRPSGLSYEPSYYALYITPYVLFWNAKYMFDPSFHRVKSSTGLFFSNLFLIVSTSTGVLYGYLMFICVVVASYLYIKSKSYIAVTSRKIKYFFLAAFVFTVSLTVIFRKIMLNYFFKFVYIGLAHSSFQARWVGVKNCWHIFLDHPIFGVGLGGVGPYLYSQSNKVDSSTPLYQLEHYDPTNVTTEILASQGLAGCISYLFLACLYWKGFKKMLQLPEKFIEQKQTALALFISLLVSILVLQFNQGLFRNYIWIHSAIVYSYINYALNFAKKSTD